MTRLDYAIEELLPHASPMILLDSIEAEDEMSVTTTVEIRPDAPFYRNEGMPSHVAIEYMAQACAAYIGLQAIRSGQKPKIGFLLGTRNFSACVSFFQKGETLSVTATIVYKDGEMGVFDCLVRRGDAIVASAKLTVFQPQTVIELGASVD